MSPASERALIDWLVDQAAEAKARLDCAAGPRPGPEELARLKRRTLAMWCAEQAPTVVKKAIARLQGEQS